MLLAYTSNRQQAATCAIGNRNAKVYGEILGNDQQFFQEARNIDKKLLAVDSLRTQLKENSRKSP